MINYRWTNVYFNADANKVGKELEELENSLDSLDTKNIVNFAKDEKSELHKCFEWDDKVAGEKYRLQQANQILTSISIVSKEEDSKPEVVRAFVNIKDSEDNERKFKNIAKVLENEDEYSQIKKKAYDDLVRCKDRYSKIIELSDLKEIIFDLYKNT